ncbi:hypothetical protein [Nostoc sp. CENA543]|uniref:hypothetical protein n=1 Tax=Nostoc sp. CENA543 TaxID=1869241 RepID=UPI001CEF98A5|nr:hypothetical protein [Nostoc sp. CENA543]
MTRSLILVSNNADLADSGFELTELSEIRVLNLKNKILGESDNCSTLQPTKLPNSVLFSEIVTNFTGIGLDSSMVRSMNSHSLILTAKEC